MDSVTLHEMGIPALFSDRHMNVQFIRTMGYEAYGGASSGECYVAASEIVESKRDEWAPAWSKLAAEMEARAERAATRGRRHSASARYLRAFNYYRNSEFYASPQSSEKLELFRSSQRCFDLAMKDYSRPYRKAMVEYQDTELPVFFWTVDDSGVKRPTIILHGGGDASGEEMLLMGGVAALERGYNVISFEGPGQRGFLYDNPNHPFCPDYEHAVTPIFDWAEMQPEVDMAMIAFSAISLGGYTGSRAMAFESRAKAFIVNAPMTDFHALLVQSFSLLTGSDIAEDELVEKLDQFYQMKMPSIEFAIEQLYWILGTTTIAETLEKMKQFRLQGIEEKISCPTLCLFAEAEGAVGTAQLEEFTQNLTVPFDVIRFDSRSGANTHCMLNNYVYMYEEMFDWLDQTFGLVRP